MDALFYQIHYEIKAKDLQDNEQASNVILMKGFEKILLEAYDKMKHPYIKLYVLH